MAIVKVYEDFEKDVICVRHSDGREWMLTREFLVDLECPPDPKDLIEWLEQFVRSFGRPAFRVVEFNGAFYPNDPEGIHI